MTAKRTLPMPEELGEEEWRFISPTVNTGVTEEEGRVLRRIALSRISPDFSQPRRVLPEDLHRRLRSGEIGPQEALRELLRRGESGDLVARFVLSRIEGLANSIARAEVGLRHPVNVYEVADPQSPTGRSYRIAEGECRWWAYHLLALRGREEAEAIPCLIEAPPEREMTVLARQQAENLARWKLPAVAQARALKRAKQALQQLFQDALDSPANLDGLIEERLSALPEELRERIAREFGLGERIPTSHQLDDLVGLWLASVGKRISGRMVRNYLALLTLPPKVLELAEAAGIPERTLRVIRALPDPAAQVELTKKVAVEGLSPEETRRAARKLGAEKRETRQRPFLERWGSHLLSLSRQIENMGQADLSRLARELVERKEYERIYRALLSLGRLLEAIREVETSPPAP